MASPNLASEATTKCAACGTTSTGKFCSNCGAPFAGATCGACNAPLSPGAKFCHRCGTPAGATTQDPRSFSTALPWAVAGIALLALVALVAGQRFGRASTEPAAAAPAATDAPLAGATGAGNLPDISQMSPADAAVRLYNRVMGANERGRADSVQLFAPMAIAAYRMIGTLDLDQRYDLGRVAMVSGDDQTARAEADSILAQNPNHLLGLILAADAARARKDSTAERTYRAKFLTAAPTERAKQLPEYITHTNDITMALDAKRP